VVVMSVLVVAGLLGLAVVLGVFVQVVIPGL